MMNRSGRAKAGKREITKSGQQTTEFVAEAKFHNGILPDPETLAGYEALCPGATQWIMERVKLQQDHRMELEKAAVTGRLKLASKGQLYAFLLGLSTLAVAAYGFYLGQPLAGFGSVIVGIGAIVGAFIVGLQKEAKERAEKDRVLHGR